jgi:hypothetical protein
MAGWWFSPVSSTNKTDHHDIAEILLKVALQNKPNLTLTYRTPIYIQYIVIRETFNTREGGQDVWGIDSKGNEVYAKCLLDRWFYSSKDSYCVNCVGCLPITSANRYLYGFKRTFFPCYGA